MYWIFGKWICLSINIQIYSNIHIFTIHWTKLPKNIIAKKWLTIQENGSRDIVIYRTNWPIGPIQWKTLKSLWTIFITICTRGVPASMGKVQSLSFEKLWNSFLFKLVKTTSRIFLIEMVNSISFHRCLVNKNVV